MERSTTFKNGKPSISINGHGIHGFHGELCSDHPMGPREDLCAAVLHSPRFKSAAARDKDGMTASLVRQGAL